MSRTAYRPAWWVPGAHAHTLWGKLFRRGRPVPTRTERWDTPDADFVDVVRLDATAGPGAPRLLLMHGLEGTQRSHYAQGMFEQARRRGWGMDLLVFRSCGGETNRTRRFYHSGETTDFAFVLDRVVQEHPHAPLGLVGVSLGGNVLLKFLGERGDDLPAAVRGAAAVSVPYDLARGSRHIAQGFSRVYEAHFLRSLRGKVQAKLDRYPDLEPTAGIASVRTLYEFDDVVTAPVHGFRDAEDYYTQSSAIRWIDRVRVPTLLLSAVDDPFLPADVLDDVRAIAAGNPALHVEFVPRGGHVGFVSGRVPWRSEYYAERRAAEFLAARLAG